MRVYIVDASWSCSIRGSSVHKIQDHGNRPSRPWPASHSMRARARAVTHTHTVTRTHTRRERVLVEQHERLAPAQLPVVGGVEAPRLAARAHHTRVIAVVAWALGTARESRWEDVLHL